MTGLRERKKRATRTAIHEAAMRLFADQGFARTTIDQIADAAGVSRGTVFSYFPTKEDIVFGEGPAAIAQLEALLDAPEASGRAVAAVRDWLRHLVGWLDAGVVAQARLARDVPTVAARRLRMYRDVEDVVCRAIARDRPELDAVAARLAAASLVAAIDVAESEVARRMEHEEQPMTDEEVEALLDQAIAYTEAGLQAVGPRQAPG